MTETKWASSQVGHIGQWGEYAQTWHLATGEEKKMRREETKTYFYPVNLQVMIKTGKAFESDDLAAIATYLAGAIGSALAKYGDRLDDIEVLEGHPADVFCCKLGVAPSRLRT